MTDNPYVSLVNTTNIESESPNEVTFADVNAIYTASQCEKRIITNDENLQNNLDIYNWNTTSF